MAKGGGGDDCCMQVLKILLTILFALDFIIDIFNLAYLFGAGYGSEYAGWNILVTVCLFVVMLIDVAIIYCIWMELKEGLIICCVILTIWLIVSFFCPLGIFWGFWFSLEYILLIIYTVLLYKGIKC